MTIERNIRKEQIRPASNKKKREERNKRGGRERERERRKKEGNRERYVFLYNGLCSLRRGMAHKRIYYHQERERD